MQMATSQSRHELGQVADKPDTKTSHSDKAKADTHGGIILPNMEKTSAPGRTPSAAAGSEAQLNSDRVETTSSSTDRSVPRTIKIPKRTRASPYSETEDQSEGLMFRSPLATSHNHSPFGNYAYPMTMPHMWPPAMGPTWAMPFPGDMSMPG